MINTKKVRCIETGEIFDSVTDAAWAFSVCNSAIRKNCTKATGSCAEHHFEYYGEYTAQRGITRRKVQCIETGKVYRTLCEAAKDYNGNVGNICHACRGEYHTAYGKHWKYYD